MIEAELSKVAGLLVEKRWPFRLHATYEESISRFLDVFERIDRDIPFIGLRWFFDHVETISDRSLERVRRLGGGIAIQDRMAFQAGQVTASAGLPSSHLHRTIHRVLSVKGTWGIGGNCVAF